MKAINLRTDYKKNPLGIDNRIPRLSWEIESERYLVFQTAYRIKAASSINDLYAENNLIWDTGKVFSEQTIQIKYEGKSLQSAQRIFWQVKIWDNHQNESEWSDIAWWETGLLNTADWKAEMIEPDIHENPDISNPVPFLRKEFNIEKEISSARLYVTSHGLYLSEINGKRICEDLFAPGWTSYHKRLQYQVYDVTDQLQAGENAIGIILGDGWYRGYLGWQGKKNTYGEKLSLLLQLKIVYSDGSEELILSDKSWKCSTGPILKSDIYNGETYDARLEIPGWSSPNYDAKNWKGIKIKPYNKSILVASEGEKVRITQTILPIEKIITPKGELVYDLGQNITGWVQLQVAGKTGSEIILNHAEVLDKDGNFYTENLRCAKAEDRYILKGTGTEIFEPHFTFHGFRYIKISGNLDKVKIKKVLGKVIHSDLSFTGRFECSNPLINQLQQNIQWSLRGNFLDVPTDCPQRDERLGWTGDAQVFSPTACFNVNASAFFSKWLKDFIADQRIDGSIPWVVPMTVEGGGGTGWSDGYGATGWADAAVIIPWVVYQTYGNIKILEDQYPSMKAWVEYMRKHAGQSYIFDHGFHFGDWLAFAEYMSYHFNAPDYGYAGATTDKSLIATAFFYYSTNLLQKTAEILGFNEDVATYKQILPKIKEAYAKEFITPSGRLVSATQTAYALTLAFNLAPEDMKPVIAKRLADDVIHFGHLTTGFLGTPYLCQALTDNGYPELAYNLLFNQRYPSWLYPVTKGATTIWERWDCIKPDGTFQTPGMNSFNHYAYGAVGHWLYSYVAGLKINPEYPGYKQFIIKPYPVKDLQYVKVEYQSVYGRITIHWQWKNQNLEIKLIIPPNTKAEVYLPEKKTERISVNEITLEKSTLIKLQGITDGRLVVEAGSGTYSFVIADHFQT